jgi:hypothetical protein
MGKKKKTQKKPSERRPAQKSSMTLSEKFNLMKLACLVLTAVITIVLLAIFF